MDSSYLLINQPSWMARTCYRGLHFPYLTLPYLIKISLVIIPIKVFDVIYTTIKLFFYTSLFSMFFRFIFTIFKSGVWKTEYFVSWTKGCHLWGLMNRTREESNSKLSLETQQAWHVIRQNVWAASRYNCLR